MSHIRPQPQLESPDGATHARVATLLRCAVVLAIAMVVIFADIPGSARWTNVLQNSAHAPAFAVVFLLIANWFYDRNRTPQGQDTRVTWLIAFGTFAITLSIGVTTEGIQWLIGHDAEVDDIFHDFIGSAGAGAIWLYWRLARPRDRGQAATWCCLTIGIACGIVWAQPLVACAAAYWHRAADFPVIARFATQGDLYFTEVRGSPSALVGDAGPHAADDWPNRPALEIALRADRWPGVALIEPKPDWSGYRTLIVAVTNPNSSVLEVQVRVDDAPNGKRGNTFTESFPCAPRHGCLHSIDLHKLVSSRQQPLDLRQIARVIVFHRGPAEGQQLRVHGVWLER